LTKRQLNIVFGHDLYSNHAYYQAATTTASGTLKAISVADGTATIATESGDELVLKVTGESKILASKSISTLTQLDTVIGSKVSVEYDTETKTVKSLNIQN
jgi:hypothetical protein